jgi:hypothetical protein
VAAARERRRGAGLGDEEAPRAVRVHGLLEAGE